MEQLTTQEINTFIGRQLHHLKHAADFQDWKTRARPVTHHYLIEFTGAYFDTFITLRAANPVIAISTKNKYIQCQNKSYRYDDRLDLNDYYETCYIASR